MRCSVIPKELNTLSRIICILAIVTENLMYRKLGMSVLTAAFLAGAGTTALGAGGAAGGAAGAGATGPGATPSMGPAGSLPPGRRPCTAGPAGAGINSGPMRNTAHPLDPEDQRLLRQLKHEIDGLDETVTGGSHGSSNSVGQTANVPGRQAPLSTTGSGPTNQAAANPNPSPGTSGMSNPNIGAGTATAC